MKIAGWILLGLGFLGFVFSAGALTVVLNSIASAGGGGGLVSGPAALAHMVDVIIRCLWASAGVQLLGALCLLLDRVLRKRVAAGFPVLPS